jgi:hypothetical protein
MTFKRGRDPKELLDIGLLMNKRGLLKKIIINNIRFLRMDILLRPGDIDLIEQVNIHLDQEKDDYKGISRIKFSEPEMEQILNEYDELMEPVYKVLRIQMKKARKELDVARKQMKEL